MTRMFLSVPSVSSVVIVLERSGEAGRQCDIVRELAGDFVVYERFFAEPADRANDEQRGQIPVSIGRHEHAPRYGSSRSFGVRLMRTFIALTCLFLLGGESLASQAVLDLPPRSRQNERAVTGGKQKVDVDTNAPLSVLIERLEGDWQEVMTGKAYWFGYTKDMYSIAARADGAIAPLLSFAKNAPSPHAKYGAILTLHLIGIDRRITGRFSEEFKNPRARNALLDCLADDSLRDDAMLMLIRDPWPSDIPRLMRVMRNSHSDCWTIVNGIFRYKLKGIPFRQTVPGQVANKPINFMRPENIEPDQFFWDILRSMKRVAAESLVLEEGLMERKLWGYSCTGYGGGNAGPGAIRKTPQ
jgi:hypothetical protein